MTDDKTLTVLKNLNGNPLVYSLLHCEKDGLNYFLGELYARRAETNLLGALSELIILDENALSVACAKGETPSDYVIDAFYDDVNAIFNAAASLKCDKFSLGAPLYGLDEGKADFKNLSEFYKSRGYGKFIKNKAFTYNDGELLPVINLAPTRLCDLKDYEEEKRAVIFNVENFLQGLPCGNVLLYGDRGTGKSSTVQAILNEYAPKGLRLIQLNKNDVGKLDDVRAAVYGNPLKFIIFIDDLSLTQDSPALSAFKAALEGSVSDSKNCIVIATSNRRHIIKEDYAERQNDLHPEDAVQDTISLSDRFALTVLFSSTNKQQYLSIVKQLATDGGFYGDMLLPLAERWALQKGGRSPRTAKQFCDYCKSCVSRGITIDF